MNRILFLDNSVDDDVYQPLIYWEPLILLPFDFFRVSTGQWPDGLDSYSHILITGSTASVLDDTDWMQTEVELIQNAVNKGKVILGSCFGHQMIARSLFGLDAVRRREKPEIGWPDIHILASDSLLGEAGRTINRFDNLVKSQKSNLFTSVFDALNPVPNTLFIPVIRFQNKKTHLKSNLRMDSHLKHKSHSIFYMSSRKYK